MTPSLLTANETRHLVVRELELLTAAEYDAAESLARRVQVPIEQAIAERCRVPLRFLLEQVAGSWGVGFTELKIADIDTVALRLLREEVARSHGVCAFRDDEHGLAVAMPAPRDAQLIGALRKITGRSIVPFLAGAANIRRAYLLYRPELRAMLDRSENDAGLQTGAADVTTMLDRMLQFAALSGASDVHIEPYAGELLIRCRIDGVLRDVFSEPAALAQPLAARIKAVSGLRIDERRAPQDGRFETDIAGVPLDLRVSTLPTQWGEKIVMRVIPREGVTFDLDTLGLLDDDYALLDKSLAQPHGMLLVTGPTGSGKSTSLYAMITRLSASRRSLVNISTIEDPVEHGLARVAQVSVNAAAGIDFPGGLRALLRQDPDVIMVGEIRDRETAEVAVRAALVGRLLLSTLHTNDTAAAIPRLIDMGVEPYLLASSLSVVVAQRLVRRICIGCRQSVAFPASTLASLQSRADFAPSLEALRQRGMVAADGGVEGRRLFRGAGCARCAGSGFSGRLGVFEILEVGDEVRQLILEKADAGSIRDAAVRRGMRTMFDDGLAKALMGETTIEELLRVVA